MTIPAKPKIYHIVHFDRLPSIVADGGLFCDAEIQRRNLPGTTIGMNAIKSRRLTEIRLTSHPELLVGECVPFYFCPRSVMLYLIAQANHQELSYRGGQDPIIHLEADLYAAVQWATRNNVRWAFTLSNAGSYFFEDRANLANLDEVDWDAVQARNWQHCKDGKQAEFLMESDFPWGLIERIGVKTEHAYNQVMRALPRGGHRPPVEILTDWYY